MMLSQSEMRKRKVPPGTRQKETKKTMTKIPSIGGLGTMKQ